MLKDQRRAGAAGAARCWRPPAAPTAAGPEPSSFRLRSVNTNSTQDSLDRGPDAQPVRRPRARPRAEDHPSAGHVIELHHPLRHVERMVIRKGYHAGRELDALRSFARRGEEHLGRADHLPAAGMMLSAPEFFVPELVQMLHEVEIAAELQHRVLTDRMVGGEEGAEVQT